MDHAAADTIGGETYDRDDGGRRERGRGRAHEGDALDVHRARRDCQRNPGDDGPARGAAAGDLVNRRPQRLVDIHRRPHRPFDVRIQPDRKMLARQPDPQLLLKGYMHSALTLNFIRALLAGELGDRGRCHLTGSISAAPNGMSGSRRPRLRA